MPVGDRVWLLNAQYYGIGDFGGLVVPQCQDAQTICLKVV